MRIQINAGLTKDKSEVISKKENKVKKTAKYFDKELINIIKNDIFEKSKKEYKHRFDNKEYYRLKHKEELIKNYLELLEIIDEYE